MSGEATDETRAAPATLAGSAGGDRALLWAASAVILIYALVAVPAVFTVDGAIYRAMADALVRDGSFEIRNGYQIYHAQTLDLIFTVPVGDRLVAQYPNGWAFLAAPFYALGGLRGLFLLNALATVATIWLVRDTTRELFEDGRAATAAALIYVFATFAFDYAGAVWPHGVTVLGIAAATAAAARAWRRDRPGWALAAGLALGLALNCRVDAVFAAAAIGFWLITAGRRPWAGAGAFALGLLPGLLAAATINLVKFGRFNPITYGRSAAENGATGLGFYADLLPLAVAGVVLMLALGFERVRRIAYRPVSLALAAGAIAALALLPPLAPVVTRLLSGAGALLIDLQAFRWRLPDYQLATQPDDTVLVFGYYKKALLQSLPWLAGAVVLAPWLVRGRRRAGLALLLVLAACLVLPFAWSAWVGGRGNHMRYLVNLLPAASILGGLTLARLLDAPGRSRLLAMLAGCVTAAAGLALGWLGGHAPLYVLQISLANMLAAVLAALAVAVLLLRGPARQAALSACKGVFAASLVMALLSAWGLDLVLHQGRRAKLLTIAEAARALPADAVIQSLRIEGFFERLNRPPGIVIRPVPDRSIYDHALIRRLLADGRAVYVQQKAVADRMIADGVAGSATPALGLDPLNELYRITPP